MEMILDKDLKMTTEIQNISNLTEKRIKKLTMSDLKEIFSNIEEKEAQLMVNAIKENKYDKAAAVLEFVTYKTIQKKVTG